MNFEKEKITTTVTGALTAAILISGNGVAVAAQELNGQRESMHRQSD